MRAVLLLLLAAALTLAQAPTPAPAAKPADVESLDAILKALYDTISGPAGAPRDWDRLRSLFAPGARMIPVRHTQDGRSTPAVVDVEGYISRSAPFFAKEGFYESELGRRVEQFGSITHVFSAYAARRAPDAAPFIRGVNSIQLVKDRDRWYVLTILWDTEREGLSLPAELLKK